MQFELVPPQGAAQFLFETKLFLILALQVSRELERARPRGLLDVREGEVGAAAQFVARGSVARREGVPQRNAELDEVPAQLKGPVQGRVQRLHGAARLAYAAQARQQQRELVGAHVPGEGARPRELRGRARQPLGNRLQEFVTDLLPVQVVDPPEPVEVEIDQGEAAARR